MKKYKFFPRNKFLLITFQQCNNWLALKYSKIWLVNVCVRVFQAWIFCYIGSFKTYFLPFGKLIFDNIVFWQYFFVVDNVSIFSLKISVNLGPRFITFFRSAHNKVKIINQIDLFNYTAETENNGFFLYIGPNTLNIKLHFLADCFRTDQFL